MIEYTNSSPSEWSQKFILLRKISFSHAKTFSSFRSNSSAFESRFGMLFHILLYAFQNSSIAAIHSFSEGTKLEFLSRNIICVGFVAQTIHKVMVEIC